MHTSMHVICVSKWFVFLLNSCILLLKDDKSPSRVMLWLMGVLDTNWFLQLSWKPHGIERRAVFKEITRVRQIEETVWKAVWPMATTAQGNLKWPVRSLKAGNFVTDILKRGSIVRTRSLSRFALQGWRFCMVSPHATLPWIWPHRFSADIWMRGQSPKHDGDGPDLPSLCQHLRGERLLAAQSELPACDMPLF